MNRRRILKAQRDYNQALQAKMATLTDAELEAIVGNDEVGQRLRGMSDDELRKIAGY